MNFRGRTIDARGENRTAGRVRRWLVMQFLTIVCCFAGFLVRPLQAQVYTTSVTGIVQDPSGAVIPGAKVTVTDMEKGFTFSTTTNGIGIYRFPNLTPSTYKLSVEAQGFQTYTQSGINLVVNQNATINVTLKVGATTQTVNITGAAPLLQAQDATTGQTVDRHLINDLPLVGRSVFDLAFLTPGINPPPTSVFGPNQMANNFTSNGGRNATADILIDGVTVTAPEQNTQILNPLYTPSVDAVQEYKVEQKISVQIRDS